METVTLKATPRTTSGKGPARQLRSRGRIPAVAYGLGAPTTPIAIERDALRSILLSKRGRNSVIKLEVENGASSPVMVQEYTVHPVSRDLLHADFIRIDTAKALVVEVPFRTTGRSKGEGEGGTLLTTVRSIRLRCLPEQIPDEITYDVSELEINDSVRVKELPVSAGTEPLLAPDRKVITVAPPRIEAEPTEEEAAEGEDAAEGAETAAEGEGEGAGDAKAGDDATKGQADTKGGK